MFVFHLLTGLCRRVGVVMFDLVLVFYARALSSVLSIFLGSHLLSSCLWLLSLADSYHDFESLLHSILDIFFCCFRLLHLLYYISSFNSILIFHAFSRVTSMNTLHHHLTFSQLVCRPLIQYHAHTRLVGVLTICCLSIWPHLAWSSFCICQVSYGVLRCSLALLVAPFCHWRAHAAAIAVLSQLLRFLIPSASLPDTSIHYLL